MTARGLLILGLLFSLAQAHAARLVDSDQWTRQYDRYFRKYTKHYFGPHFEWRWFKSQAIAESNLNPRAKSHAGAKGIMQILPSTYGDIKAKNPHFYDIDNPKWNIAAGIYYDRQLYRKWQRGFNSQERLALMFAGYNAGHGAIRRAYKKALKQIDVIKKWRQLEAFVPSETKKYVKKIRLYMKLR